MAYTSEVQPEFSEKGLLLRLLEPPWIDSLPACALPSLGASSRHVRYHTTWRELHVRQSSRLQEMNQF